jgi:hypothetical protein
MPFLDLNNNQLNTREKVAEVISRRTLGTSAFTGSIDQHQQVISNGILQLGVSGSQPIVMYRSDFLGLAGVDKADFNLLLQDSSFQSVVSNLINEDLNYEINWLTGSAGAMQGPPNVSQFMTFITGSIGIDPSKLTEVLDTTITELLPYQPIRQDEIDSFFSTYLRLVPPDPPPYCGINGGYALDTTGECNDGYTYEQWLQDNSISYLQDLEMSDENAFITRLIQNENINNSGQSLEWLYQDLARYLKDTELDDVVIADERPDYEHTSKGYLKIRNLNQAILIKKGELGEVGLDHTEILGDVTSGGEYSTCGAAASAWLQYYATDDNFQCGMEIPKWLLDGFTITQWVKFKDKVNSGTLFNFGNPLRLNNPMGFRLESIVVSQDDVINPDEAVYFTDNNYERFVRLVVREADGSLRASNVGRYEGRVDTKELNNLDDISFSEWTRVPIDFDEWYFVVASYHPITDEDYTPTYVASYEFSTDYWLGNILDNSQNTYTHKSGLGLKCKVEIISKSDLLRARGYKPIET